VFNLDYIIVGSGINSLVAGALLSRAGKRVLILERSKHIGGCMETREVTLPGFKHDVMSTTFVLFLTSPAYSELQEDLDKHGLKFCHTNTPTAIIRPDGTSLILTTDQQKNVNNLNNLRHGDGDQFLNDINMIAEDSSFLFFLLGGPLWSWQTLQLFSKQIWKKGFRNFVNWFGHSLISARTWLETSYEHPLTQALFAPWVLHTGLTPESAYSGQMGKVIAFALEAAGAPIVRGGAEQAAASFRRLIEANGGKFQCFTDVDEVIVENGKVRGVITSQGEKIKANGVIVSVTPSQLNDRLLRNGTLKNNPEEKKFRHGRGNFQIHYALDADPEWHNPDLGNAALIHLSDGINSVSKSSNEAERGLLPETPTICVGQPSKLDPTRCPEGKSIFWIQIPDAPFIIKGDSANRIDCGSEWNEQVKELFADRVENILANHIPNFKTIKLARKCYSPKDLSEMNINLVGGDPYGGSCSIDQFFIWRAFPNSLNNETPIKNLYHIGASTHPGPGLSGGSGFNLAKRLGA
jgi:phytoene dehydrogenase-like protein